MGGKKNLKIEGSVAIRNCEAFEKYDGDTVNRTLSFYMKRIEFIFDHFS